MSQEEEYWEGNVDTCFRKKDIGKEMFTHVSGRRILRRKCLHMSQEEGYWEGNAYTCFRKKDIRKEMFTHISGRWILMRKKLTIARAIFII